MILPAAVLLTLVLQTPGTPSAPSPEVQPNDTTPLPLDSFADSAAEDLLRRTRLYAEETKSDIEAYRLLSRYTLSVGLSTARRDRLLYKRELGWRVSWRRDEEWRVDVLASRETLPLFLSAPQAGDYDDELETLHPDFIIGNRGQWILRMPDQGGRSGNSLNHPLAEGSERHYQFATGDTTRIQIPGREPLTLIELKITPRLATSHHVIGSWWLDSETAAPVRAAFRLAAPAKAIIDTSERRILPGLGNKTMEVASFDLDYLTLEYALWEDRWWLPRLLALQGRGRVGGIEVPLLIEQTFEEVELFARGDAWSPLPPPDSALFKQVEAKDDADDEAEDEVQGESVAVQDTVQRRVTYVPRADSLLVSSPYLPDSPFEIGSSLSASELDRLMSELDVGLPGIALGRPEVSWAAVDPGLFRYNRVEGFTLGTRLGVRYGPLSLGATARLGLAGPTPSGSLSLKRGAPNGEASLRLYSDIAAFTPADRPLALGNSANALFFGNDDGDYFRASGIAASLQGRFSRFNWSEVAITAFAERQAALERNTEWSFASWSRDLTFRPNPAADRASQLGAELSLGARTGVEAGTFRGGSSIRLAGETGTFDFAKASLDGYLGFPLPGPLVGSLEGAGGRIFGTAPVQRLWYVGGSSTVRGFQPEERFSGTSFWRGRAEIATGKPRLRGLVFIDAGYAGNTFTGADPQLISAGFGISALDGIVRADIARAARGGSGWGLQLYLDAPL